MDMLYLLLPIIGAFLLLFIVCCFGRKVKEMLHIPKELVLGRNFPGLEPSSRSSESDSDMEGDEPPPIIVNMNSERQRVLGLSHAQQRLRRRARYNYTQLPCEDSVYKIGRCGADYRHSMMCARNQHRKSVHRMYESCPALFDDSKSNDHATGMGTYGTGAGLSRIQEPISGHVANGPGLHPGRPGGYDGGGDDDSDVEIPFNKVLRWLRMPLDRQRSSSESDLLWCSISESLDFGYINPRFSHRLSATEIQLHATEDCDVIVQVANHTSVSNQAEVG